MFTAREINNDISSDLFNQVGHLQRFGSGSVPTHTVGAALLRGEWKTAVDLILQPREDDILPLRLGLSKLASATFPY